MASSARSSGAWQALAARVKREEHTCHLCRRPIDPALQYPDPMSFSADHVRPLIKGGALLDRANVRAAHLRCNISKHDKASTRRPSRPW